ncbi:TPR repeat-containing protein [Cryptosporidium andersoni]|uniref:TPR repeat-containing protein n=1 Tax=Cryptosporidium andersoni TaxID=117008 RepID=A0A1J4MV89_9CRYT|nr:TPR repeat-containing protein [Cryptosporidium andersoni]
MLHPTTSYIPGYDDEENCKITDDIQDTTRYQNEDLLSSLHGIFHNKEIETKLNLSDNDTDQDSDIQDLLMMDYNRSRLTKKKKRKSDKELKRKTGSTPVNVSPEVEKLLQKANDAYLAKEFMSAIEILEEVVKKAPGLHDPFHMLGLIYEQELDDKAKAAEFYFLAAHLVVNDIYLWKRIGQMSCELEMWERAIYCYKRCLRNIGNSDSQGELDEFTQIEDEIRFELSNAYLKTNNIIHCIQQLKILFRRHPGDPLLGKELAKCYHQIGKLNMAAEILESCLIEETDLHIINMLCEVYIDLKLYQKCLDLVQNMLISKNFENTNNSESNEYHLSSLEKTDIRRLILTLPIDISVKYAVSGLYIGNRSVADELTTILKESNMEKTEVTDLHQSLGDAYFAVKIYNLSKDHYEIIYHTDGYERSIALSIKYAYSLQSLGNFKEAAQILEDSLTENKHQIESFEVYKAKALLASLYSKMGYTKLGEKLIYTMKYEDLVQMGDLSQPIPQELRCNMILELFSKMKSLFTNITVQFSTQIDFVDKAINPPKLSQISPEICGTADMFEYLIKEFLTDIKRVSQKLYSKKFKEHDKEVNYEQNSVNNTNLGDVLENVDLSLQHTNDSTSKSSKKLQSRVNIPTSKIRSELGIVTLGEILTSEDEYWGFLTYGAIVLQWNEKYNVAVEVFEKILNNIKMFKPEIYLDRLKAAKNSIHNLIISLAFNGGLWRTLLSYLRLEFNKKTTINKHLSGMIGRILLVPHIFNSCVKHNNFRRGVLLEKEVISETRSWIQRQSPQFSNEAELNLITAHLYVISNRIGMAVLEYTKAHRSAPFDNLIVLCLGISFISLATAKDTKNRQSAVLKGFAFISRYIQGRLSIFGHNPLFKAECLYNKARAYHQINLKNEAILLYTQCIETLQNIKSQNKNLDFIQLMNSSLYNLSLLVNDKQIQNLIIW